MQQGSAPETGNTEAPSAHKQYLTESHGAILDKAEGSEAAGDNASDGLLPASQERRPQANRTPSGRNRKRGWSVIELSTLVLLHAIHGNKWSVIARHYRNRHDGDVKNIFHSALRSKATETNSLLRAYAQAVGPNCDDPAVRQAAYEAARQQYGSGPLLSSAASYLNQSSPSSADKLLEEGEQAGSSRAQASAEDGLTPPEQPLQPPLAEGEGGPSQQADTDAQEAATSPGGPGRQTAPLAAQAPTPISPPRRSRRLARSTQIAGQTRPGHAESDAEGDGRGGGGGGCGSSSGGAAVTAAAAAAAGAAPFRPSQDPMLQPRIRGSASEMQLSGGAFRGVSKEGECEANMKRAWGEGGTEALHGELPEAPTAAAQRGGGMWIHLGVEHTLASTPQLTDFSLQQAQQLMAAHTSPSLQHTSLTRSFGHQSLLPPLPPLPPLQQPQQQPYQEQQLAYRHHSWMGAVGGHGPLHGSPGLGPQAVGMYGNNPGFPRGSMGLTSAASLYPATAPRMVVQQPPLMVPLRALAPHPAPSAVYGATDPKATNPLPLGLGYAAAPMPYLPRSTSGDGSSSGGGLLRLGGSIAPAGMRAPASGLPSEGQRLAAAAEAMRDPEIISLAAAGVAASGTGTGGGGGSSGRGGVTSSHPEDPLEALLRDLESPFTSAASLLGSARPVESSNPLRLLTRPRLPVDPISLPGPGPPGPGQLGTQFTAPRLAVGTGVQPGSMAGLVGSAGQIGMWTAGYPSMPPTPGHASGIIPFPSTVPAGSATMGLHCQYDPGPQMRGLMPQPQAAVGGAAAASRISSAFGSQLLAAPTATAAAVFPASATALVSGSFVLGPGSADATSLSWPEASDVSVSAHPSAWSWTGTAAGAGAGAMATLTPDASLSDAAPSSFEGAPLELPLRHFWPSATQQQQPSQMQVYHTAVAMHNPFTTGMTAVQTIPPFRPLSCDTAFTQHRQELYQSGEGLRQAPPGEGSSMGLPQGRRPFGGL